MNKKGIGLGEAFGAVLTLILVATLVIISIYIFYSLEVAIPNTPVSVSNESLTMIGPSIAVLSGSNNCSFGGLSISGVTNLTGSSINSGNYTVNSTGLMNVTSVYGRTWLVNYSYQWGGQACVATNTMITQFGTYPALVGLVGTIIFLGIVIGVLVGSFAFRSRRGA